MTILSGHTSPETAYLVEDYPYGFRLRCKIRYWLEYKPGKGFRLVSQTTNPNKRGEPWNKPKALTYAMFGGVMYLDDNDHVRWTNLTEYTETARAQAFLDTYGHTMPEDAQAYLAEFIRRRIIFEAQLASGEIAFTTTIHKTVSLSPLA